MTLFDDYVRRTAEQEAAQRIAFAIRQSVAPFDPGDIFIATQQLMGVLQLHVSCRNWPSMGTVFDISRLDFLRYPEDAYLAIMRLVADHFRNNLEYITPESQFELGEN